MGRVGSLFDCEHLPVAAAAAESFFSTLEHEVFSRHRFTTKAEARAVITPWCEEFYNKTRRHSAANMLSPIDYDAPLRSSPPQHDDVSTIPGEAHPTGIISMVGVLNTTGQAPSDGATNAAATAACPRLIPPSLQGNWRCVRTVKPLGSRRSRHRATSNEF